MDNIREWISDNLRYILLVLAMALILAVAILGIRAISNIANGNGNAGETQQAAPADEPTSEASTMNDVIVETEPQDSLQSASLVQNDPKVLTTMTSYYSARSNSDVDTLKKLDPSLGDQELANMINSYVESYSNVSTYSMNGKTEGSYVAYVCYDGKVKDIDTLVPSLTRFYLQSNEDGSLYIADTEGNGEIEAFLEETRTTPEVQALYDTVVENCRAAEDSDPALKEFMKQYGISQSTDSADEPESGEEGSEGEGTEMVANDGCNIRAEANTDAEILGGLYPGDTITKTGETDDGWTIVDFDGQTAYVKSEFLSTPEEAEAAQDADYFAPAAAE